MDSVKTEICVCKGIRSCLICERVSGFRKKNDPEKQQNVACLTFCHMCGLCWPSDNSSNDSSKHSIQPIFLPGIFVFPNFLSEEEEANAVSCIDQVTWMPSQSGRRKQDFGPKVNFKKRKVKLHGFHGFPSFASTIVQKLNQIPELSNFYPVEVCNLEYCPERGSAIEPHVDDSWLWGERLVTVNLLSSTTLTLSPVEMSHCGILCQENNCGQNCCVYKENVTNNLSKNCHLQESAQSHPNSFSIIHSNSELQNSFDYRYKKDLGQVCFKHKTLLHTKPSNVVNDCNIKMKCMVDISLPPRSLLVLYGCARHHWYHSISRTNIQARRLAVTFRELSPEFLCGGAQSVLGKQLLDIAKLNCC